MKKIPVEKIRCVDDRKHSAAKVSKMKKSLTDPEIGLLEAIGIQSYNDESGQYEYNVAFGRCRFNILKESGKKYFILGGNSPDLVLREGNADVMAYIENEDREDLSLWEEVKTLRKLMKTFATIADMADAINRSTTWVAKRINLLNLSKTWRKALKENEFQYFGIGHFEVIATFDKIIQDEIFEEYSNELSDEKISVKNLESKFYEEFAPALKELSWNVNGKLKGCGECPLCKAQENQSYLFEEYTNAGRCMNKAYLKIKLDEYLIETAKNDPALILYADTYGYSEEWSPFEEEKIITNYDCREVENTDDGEKALIVYGENVGAFTYIQKRHQCGNGSSDSSEPKAKRSLEERKEMKNRQRQRLAIDSLIEFIKEEKYEVPTREIIFALIACKGVNSAFYNAWDDLEKDESKIKSEIKSFATALAMDESELNKKVWLKLRYKLIEELKYGQTGPVPSKWDEAEILSQIISFDIEKAFEEATTALPDPKSWAKEKSQLQEAA